jgi:hypothetical protein
MGQLSKMTVAALALVTLAVSTVVGITILREFANTTAIVESDVTPFITGLAIFGTFSTILAIVIVGKVVLDLVRTKN